MNKQRLLSPVIFSCLYFAASDNEKQNYLSTTLMTWLIFFSSEMLLIMFSNNARSQSKHCRVVSAQSLGCTPEMEVPGAVVSTTTHTRSYTVEDLQHVLTTLERQAKLY